MISKILMCPCYKEELCAAGNDCIKESIYFKWMLEETIYLT